MSIEALGDIKSTVNVFEKKKMLGKKKVMWIVGLVVVILISAGVLYWNRDKIQHYVDAFNLLKSKRITVTSADIAQLRHARAAETSEGITVLPNGVISMDDYFDNGFDSPENQRFRTLWKTLLNETEFQPGTYQLTPKVRKGEGPENTENVSSIAVTDDHIKMVRVMLEFEGWSSFDYDADQMAKMLGKKGPVDEVGNLVLSQEDERYYERLRAEAVFVLQAFLQHGAFSPGTYQGDIGSEDMAKMISQSMLGGG